MCLPRVFAKSRVRCCKALHAKSAIVSQSKFRIQTRQLDLFTIFPPRNSYRGQAGGLLCLSAPADAATSELADARADAGDDLHRAGARLGVVRAGAARLVNLKKNRSPANKECVCGWVCVCVRA